MRVARHAGAAVLLLLLLQLVGKPASAQRYNWELGVNGGWTWWTRPLSLHDFGISDAIIGDQVFTNTFDSDHLNLGSSGIGGATLGYWFKSWLGLRANFAFSEADLDQGDFRLFNSINNWSGTGDVLFRFLKPRERWRGMEWLPYAALGAGAQWVNPSGDNFIMRDNITDIDFETINFVDGLATVTVSGTSGIPIVCRLGVCSGPATPGFTLGGIDPNNLTRTFFLREASTFAGLVALGTDIRVAPSFAIKVEAGDRIYRAPISEVVQVENLTNQVIEIDHNVGKTINQFYLVGGVSYLWGLHRPREVAMAPQPAPPPPPPPPPPTTESITVCVVDPTSDAGLRNITATRNLQTGDTTVMVNGNQVPLSSALGNVPVATNAPWFMTGAPLEIGTAPNHLVYLAYGSSRTADPSELVYLGTVGGMPVFMGRGQNVPLLDNLGPNTDLSRIVTESNDVRSALSNVKEVLVPLGAVGCTFQPMALQVEVRKGK